MYQQQSRHSPHLVPLPPAANHGRSATSHLAVVAATALGIIFVVVTFSRAVGAFTRVDLRVVAHVVSFRFHPRVLALVHPLVHLGDAAFMVGASAACIALLWLRGCRRTWTLLAGLLSWPIELGCKAILPQPAGLGRVDASVTVASLVHGTGTRSVAAWLHHAAPGGVGDLVHNAGATTLSLTSSYPSGTTARGTFVLGLLIWLCLRAGLPVLSELAALLALAPLAVLGLSMVLYAWHWPSDVLGGYILGLWLLSIAVAAIKSPAAPLRTQCSAAPGTMPHSKHSRLPWVLS